MWEGFFFFTSTSVHIYKLLPCESTQEFMKKENQIEVHTHDHVSTGSEGQELKTSSLNEGRWSIDMWFES